MDLNKGGHLDRWNGRQSENILLRLSGAGPDVGGEAGSGRVRRAAQSLQAAVNSHLQLHGKERGLTPYNTSQGPRTEYEIK